MPSKLFFGQVAFEISEEHMRQILSAYADVVSVHIPINRISGRHSGTAFVEVATASQARAIIAALHGSNVMAYEKPLLVEFAKSPSERPPSLHTTTSSINVLGRAGAAARSRATPHHLSALARQSSYMITSPTSDAPPPYDGIPTPMAISPSTSQRTSPITSPVSMQQMEFPTGRRNASTPPVSEQMLLTKLQSAQSHDPYASTPTQDQNSYMMPTSPDMYSMSYGYGYTGYEVYQESGCACEYCMAGIYDHTVPAPMTAPPALMPIA